MVRFRNLLERLYPRLEPEKIEGAKSVRSSLARSSDVWSVLEKAIQRGLPEEVVTWRQNFQAKLSKDVDEVDGAESMVDGVNVSHLQVEEEMFEQMNTNRYTRRLPEYSGNISISPLQLAVIEKKVDVVFSLLIGLSPDQVFKAITNRMSVLEKAESQAQKKSFAETRKMFSVSSITGSVVPMESLLNRKVDWTDPMEWNTLHLAVIYDTDCLKVLLFLMENHGIPSRVAELLENKDSKGRNILHLAAKCAQSSTPTRLLLDLGAQVESRDMYGLTPVHVAVKFGSLDTVRVLLDHRSCRPSCSEEEEDPSSRNLLHYSSTPQITRYLTKRGYKPDLSTLLHQARQGGTDNVMVLLDNALQLKDNVLIFDFSLAMEQDKNGDRETDGESVFLKNLLSQRKLLRSPLAESLLWMKWFACKQVILLDLMLYFVFICCLTGVICFSTSSALSTSEERNLTRAESSLIDLVIANYRSELEKRGWKFVPRSTSNLDSVIYNIPTDLAHPTVEVPTVFELQPGTPNYHEFFGFYIFTVFLSAIFVLRESLELIAQGPTNYFKSAENIFEIFIICLTILCQIFLASYSDNVYFYEILQVLTVFFGWFGLTFHFAKLPSIGIYIHLAIKVFQQLVLSLLVFTTILLAFAFSFHLALRKHHVFDNAFTSFLKTINMMVGEYNFDYNFTFQSVRDVGGSNGMVQLLLISFILLVSVTIANLIIAIVIANINKLMVEAEFSQLEKTVSLLSTVHNVKQALIRIFPCLKKVFAPTLHDYVGQKSLLCVRITEVDPPLSWLVRLQNSVRSTSNFYPVYVYDAKYRSPGFQTDLVLPEKIVTAAIDICREREKEIFSSEAENEEYRSDWRDQVGDVSILSIPDPRQ